MSAALRPHLAAAARRELEVRENHYPAMVERGELAPENASADVAAWRAIAALFASGTADAALSWADIEAAASAALRRREEALAAKPGDQALFERFAWVEALHSRIAWHRRFLAAQPPADQAAAA